VLSVGLVIATSLVIFIGTGYITLDTAFNWTGHFNSSLFFPNRSIALYVLYQLFPLVCIAVFFGLEAYLVLGYLGERRPIGEYMEEGERLPLCSLLMNATSANRFKVFLASALLLFAIGQVFEYVISPHICYGTSQRINGSLFETLFTLLSVVMIWVFWSSITEDDWPAPPAGDTYT
jgi:hypothetical protein